MSAGNYDFKIEQGTSFRMSLVYKDANGDPIDITNWCARLTWKTSSNTTQIFTTENTDLNAYKFEIVGAAGRINFLLPASTTNAYDFNTAKYADNGNAENDQEVKNYIKEYKKRMGYEFFLNAFEGQSKRFLTRILIDNPKLFEFSKKIYINLKK